MLHTVEYLMIVVAIVTVAQFLVTVKAGVIKRRELVETTTLMTSIFPYYSNNNTSNGTEHLNSESVKYNDTNKTNGSPGNHKNLGLEKYLFTVMNDTNRVNNTEFHYETVDINNTRALDEKANSLHLSENEMLTNSSRETPIIEIVESTTVPFILDDNHNLLRDKNSVIEANTTFTNGTKTLLRSKSMILKNLNESDFEGLPQRNFSNLDSVFSFINAINVSKVEQKVGTLPALFNSTQLASNISSNIESTTMETITGTDLSIEAVMPNTSTSSISTLKSMNSTHDLNESKERVSFMVEASDNKTREKQVETSENKFINSNGIHVLSTERRTKYINDNSTNTNQLNLPDAAEVWTLAGLKTVSKDKGFDRSVVSDVADNSKVIEQTELAEHLNNSVMSSNSEKNLLDWTQIMLNVGLNDKLNKTEHEISSSAATVNESEEQVVNSTTLPVLGISREILHNDTINSTHQDRGKFETNNPVYTTENEFETEQSTTTVSSVKLGIEKNNEMKNISLMNPENENYSTVPPESTTLTLDTFPQDNDKNASVISDINAMSKTKVSPVDTLENIGQFNMTMLPVNERRTENSNYIAENEHGTTTMATGHTTNSITELNTLVVQRTETPIPFSEASITMTTNTPIPNGEAVTFTAEVLRENNFSTNLQQPPTSNNDVRPNTNDNHKSYDNENVNFKDGDDNDDSTYEFPLNETTIFSTPETVVVSTTVPGHISTQSEVDDFSLTTSASELTTPTTSSRPEQAIKPEEVNHLVTELGLDVTTELSTTAIYYKTLEEDKRELTTSSENELIISTPAITTIVAPIQYISTLPNNELEETTNQVTEKDITSEDISFQNKEPIISVEKHNKTDSESPLETKVVDPSEKLKSNTSNTSEPPTEVTTNTLPEEVHNDDIIVPYVTSTMKNFIPSTTTENPLISLLDDFTKLTTTETPSSSIAPKEEEVDYILTSTTDVTFYTIAPQSTTVEPSTTPLVYVEDAEENITFTHVLTTMLPKTSPTFDPESNAPNLHTDTAETPETDVNVIIAISFSVIGIIALILLVAFLYVMRKRQKQMSYGQRCRPVSLDAYSMENISVYNSIRRKGALRSSKISYGNIAFDDPSLRHNILSPSELSKFIERRSNVFEEFRDIPQIIARADEVPHGCEDKNRYANVIPLPETRVILQQQNGDEKTEYINANYIRGPKDSPNYYIACQAPLENTVADFWRMIWEQQSRVIVQATDIIENGVDKCAEYLPPSVTLDNHTTYGDFQIILKNREVKDKYAISTILMKNTITGTSREITHYWYKWPETGVPSDEAPIIAMLLEVRSSLKTYAVEQANEFKEKSSATKTIGSTTAENKETSPIKKNENRKDYDPNTNNEVNGNFSSDKPKSPLNNQGPLTVHCSPGTGRTGTIIACDIAIRNLETTKRNIDIPQIVYYVRRGRASSVQTKEQYEFIYRVANMYAIKISNFSGEN